MPMRSFALIGFPLGHTMSPPIHDRLFSLAGKKGDYRVWEIPPEQLQRERQALEKLAGFNVTIPHKIGILPLLSRLVPSAERYQSVNTVACTPEGMVGYNTDVDGFLGALEAAALPLAGKVCVLGCGGAGRMMCIEAVLHGCALTIGVRPSSLQRANTLKAELEAMRPGTAVEVALLENLAGPFDLLLNATPSGMFPKCDAMPVSPVLLEEVGGVFDCIYNPSSTKLLGRAKALGIPAIGGMHMLVWQAVVAHEIWDGSRYDPADISALVEEMQQKVDILFPRP